MGYFISGLRNYILAHLTKDEDPEVFAEFAFGKDFDKSIHISKFLELWNELHGEKYKLSANGTIAEDVPEMVRIWRESLSLERKQLI